MDHLTCVNTNKWFGASKIILHTQYVSVECSPIHLVVFDGSEGYGEWVLVYTPYITNSSSMCSITVISGDFMSQLLQVMLRLIVPVSRKSLRL